MLDVGAVAVSGQADESLCELSTADGEASQRYVGPYCAASNTGMMQLISCK
jgi:hypothetical protein